MNFLKKIILLCFLFAVSEKICSQESAKKIEGLITNAQNTPIESAVVSLMHANDSVLIKTAFTELDGKFEFSIPSSDTIFLFVSLTGYEPYYSPHIVISDNYQLEPIQLKEAANAQLKEVAVESKILFVEKKIDKIVVNPDALIANAGSNALEVLEKSPGIQVDLNGLISLKGKQGVTVLVDDKPTYLSSSDLANLLKSMPAASIAQIEIMSNPPAKYDAAGNAGIINIKLKHLKTKGWNGGISISYGQGFYARSNNSLNFNYRVNKINVFSVISYSVSNSYQDLSIHRNYFDSLGQLSSAFKQNTFIKMNSNTANAKLGMDYYINEKSTLGCAISGFNMIFKSTSANAAEVLDADKQPVNYVNAFSPSKRIFNNGNANLNYDYKIDSLGKELTFNLDYSMYDSRLKQSLLSNTYLPNDSLIGSSNLVSDLPARIEIKSAKADYVHPFKNATRLDAGLKTSLVNTNNVAGFYDETNGILVVNNDFSNRFKYTENINAAYLNYNIDRKKVSVQAGLRFENTSVSGNQFGNATHADSSFTRNYNNLFPTFYVLYKLDSADKNQLSLSYGRRIDRPNYQDMNPFTYPLDRFTLYAGNPFLQPTFSNTIEVSHTYKNKISTSLSYSYVKDVISETIEQSTAVFYSRPGNIGKQISYGLSVNGTFQITKWWVLQLYTEVMNNTYTATLYNQELKNSGTYWYIGPLNQFQLKKGWTIELSGNYQTEVAVAQFITVPVGAVRAGVSKKIMKNKATVKLNVSDIFYTNQPGGEIQGLQNSSAGWHSKLDTRVVTIAFSYRFNKGESLAARTTGGADSEKTRVK